MQTRRIARFRPRRHLIQRKAPARRMPNGGEKCRSTKLALLRPFPRTRNPGRPTTAAKRTRKSGTAHLCGSDSLSPCFRGDEHRY